MKAFPAPIIFELVICLIIFTVVFNVNSSNTVRPAALSEEDIFFEFNQAVGIKNGINPYQKTLTGNLLDNNKYATLLPSYYYFILGVASFSNYNFASFVTNYQIVLLFFELLAFIYIYLIFREKNQKALGIFAIAFYLLNRWTLLNITLLKQDTVAITLLIISLYYFDKKQRLSYLFYGLSLAIKHMGILIFPVYLLPIIFKQRSIKDFLFDLIVMTFPIVLTSSIFLVWDFKAFFYSMIFSITRKADSNTGTIFTGYDNFFATANLGKSFLALTLPRLPLLIFSIFNLALLLTKRVSKNLYILLSFLIFIALNPVYFDQYITWITPFVAYVGIDFKNSTKSDNI